MDRGEKGAESGPRGAARNAADGARPAAPVLLGVSISLLSASALTYEIALLRLLSLVLWHHFAAMAISLALLGYGASGTALSLWQDRSRGRIAAVFPAGCALFGAVAPASFALAQRVPFQPLAAVWEPIQWAYFGAVYLILAIPFFLAGGCLGLAYREFGRHASGLYRADLVGAGAGALAGVGLLFVMPPAGGLRVVAAGGFLAAAMAAAAPGRGSRGLLAPCTLAVVGGAVSLGWPGPWLEPRMSEYKALSQALRAPGAEILAQGWSPLGHLAAVRSPQAPFRHAPGLSLGCAWDVPDQIGLFSDGEFGGTVDAAGGDPRYRDCLPTALPYAVGARPRVLVLGAGGGGEVRAALDRGSTRVDAVELDGRVVALLGGPLRGHAGPVYEAPGVRVHVAEARAFAGACRDSYDLIQVALLDPLGASLAGAQAASENFLYTVEAFDTLLERLAPAGLLAVTRWLEVPPRGGLKLLATAAEALERRGAGSPGESLALVRTWSTLTLLVRNGAFPEAERRAVRAFCRARGFDLDWLPGLPAEDVNRFNVLERPWFYQGAREILGPGREAFFLGYPFFARPATDDRPYFFRTIRWRSFAELLAARDRGGAPLVEWAYLLALATLAQAAVAGGTLILLPLSGLRRGAGTGVGAARAGLYFAALGLAFLLVEVVTIQRLTLLLGHPVYAAGATLAAFLLFAGLGSEWSGRFFLARTRSRAIGLAAGTAAALALAHHAALPWLLPHLAALPLGLRAAAAAAFLAPLAFIMGMPFPLGLGALAARAPRAVPWGWAVNGFASVIGAALAPVAAVHVGFSGVTLLASASYLAAAWAARDWA